MSSSGNDAVLQALLQALPLAVIGTDRHGNVTLWNQAAEQLLGWQAGEVDGKLLPVVPADNWGVFQGMHEQWRLGQGLGNRESRWLRKDGTPVDVELTPVPLRDRGEGVLLLARGRGAAPPPASDLLAPMKQLESLRTLVGVTAHDFNNLLMSIIGNANLVLVRLPSESPLRESIQFIEQTVMRAAELADQLLAYAGQGQVGLQLVDLSMVVQEMAQMLDMAGGGRAAVSYGLTAQLPAIEADPLQVRQVVMNLFTNAVDAVGAQGGVVTVTTGVEDQAPESAGTPIAATRFTYVEVADTGHGIDAETMLRIFDPFFTTKTNGRGLGLPAVMGIVRKHGGAIKVYSTPGQGTTFRVLFPAVDQGAPLLAPDEYEPLPAPETSPSRTVLVVDDEEGVRTVVRAILEEFGMHVLTAKDGREAVAFFRTHHREIGVVLLDMVMPNMSGLEAYQEIRRIRADMPVILSSGYSEAELPQQLLEHGLAGFIHKPYRLEELVNKVNEILGIADE